MNRFDRLLLECISKLASENISEGVEALVDFAHEMAKCGYTQKEFAELRQYIIDEARHLSHNPNTLIIKIELAEREQNANRAKHRRQQIITPH